MHDRSPSPTRDAPSSAHSRRTGDAPSPPPREPFRPPRRTLPGLLACLTLPAAVGLALLTLAAPVLVAAAAVGFLAGVAAVLGVVRRDVALAAVRRGEAASR